MKKYFGYTNSSRDICQKPCVVNYEGLEYTSFCNSYTLALTTESTGEMELFTDVDRYLNVSKLIKYEGSAKRLDINEVIAKAKAQGYKLKKSEVDGPHCGYLMRYDGAYFKIGLLEVTFNIINNGEAVTAHHKDGDNTASLIIQNDIGIGLILPMKCDEEFIKQCSIVVIDAE